MALTITNESVHYVEHGEDNVKRLKYGHDIVWPKKEDADDALCFGTDGICYINGLAGLQYTTDDDDEWHHMIDGEPIEFGGVKGTLYVRGSAEFGRGYHFVSPSDTPFWVFGRLMALYNAMPTEGNDIRFQNTFKAITNLVDASQLSLPEEIMDSMYVNMFKDCTGLKGAPALNCSQLKYQCFESMFENCTSLEYGPNLPYIIVPSRAYASMFKGCTSLKEIPDFEPSLINESSMQEMFSGCTSLVEVHDINIYKMADFSCAAMFYGCTSLKKAPALKAEVLARSCFAGMFQNCTALETAPPELRAPLAKECYSAMFKGCTSLKEIADVYPATNFAEGCFREMYSLCTSLTVGKSYCSNFNGARDCMKAMYAGCSNITRLEFKPVNPGGGTWDEYVVNWCAGVGYGTTGEFACLSTCTLQEESVYASPGTGYPAGWTKVTL